MVEERKRFHLANKLFAPTETKDFSMENERISAEGFHL